MLPPTIQAIVLAAGSSKRFKTGRTKLIEKICGQEMILYVTKLLERFSFPTSVVIGYQKELVQEVIQKAHGNRISFYTQAAQCGTGNAVSVSRDGWYADSLLVINGDVPLVTEEIIQKLCEEHIKSRAALSFVVSHTADPLLQGYGRVVEEGNGFRIIECKDFKLDAQEYCCINAGIYLINREFLMQALPLLNAENAAQEFYLTDLIALASKQGIIHKVEAPFDRIRGVNTLKELWTVEHIKRSELISYWMEQGIRFHTAQTVHIDYDVTIEPGTYIGCGVHLAKGTRIGANCSIRCYSVLTNACIEDNVTVHSHTVITNARVASGAQVGPFAHIESNSVVGAGSIVGNFVQVKRSTLGSRVRAKHLSFLGDAQVGDNVNIGGGTITCNYDGVNKHATIIEEGVSVGSLNALIAPVILKKESMTAAGSVITHSVPEQALAIARSRQVIKEGYARTYKLNKNQKNNNPEPEVPKDLSFQAALKAGAITFENI